MCMDSATYQLLKRSDLLYEEHLFVTEIMHHHRSEYFTALLQYNCSRVAKIESATPHESPPQTTRKSAFHFDLQGAMPAEE